MRIALNARILQAPRTGIGHYVAELSQALSCDAQLELDFFHGWGWSRQLPAAALPGYNKWTTLAKQVPGAYSLRRQLDQYRFTRGVSRHAADLYHEPSLWPLEFAGPMVMTLHDLTHVHYPQTQPRDRLAEIDRRVGPAVERARFILADSQFVANEIRQHYGVAAERIKVAPLGYAERFRPREAHALRACLAQFGLQPGGYLLCVGTLEPRKNLAQALRAHALLPEALRRRFPLLIAGMPGWRDANLAPELQKALASGAVRLLGYQPDEALAELLAGARMLLFPSLYEGFGLPVLEAMASGVPVLLTARTSLQEVAGPAGVYLEPGDDQGWCAAIQRLLGDQPEWQARRTVGLQRAQEFSWKRCASITASVYRQALE
ncbi:glycosyltransferase family 4 protein [Pseudomonas sp. LS44]|uniref:glycosyltransferase family 4 protein n=1 Tax=Pseudomonas sp. LS44 TaxID=1357074 RepID=UPI00215B5AEE|nr:glycosyltransferase family 1 protein [Pseudomonas sp. LS44]UVE17954.1 glycosyltransferase family 4 protein [Pseudomonas sp. LS44]